VIFVSSFLHKYFREKSKDSNKREKVKLNTLSQAADECAHGNQRESDELSTANIERDAVHHCANVRMMSITIEYECTFDRYTLSCCSL